MRFISRGSRVFILLIVVGALVAGVLTDANHNSKETAALRRRVSVIAENAKSHLWFCVGGSARSGSALEAYVVVTNRNKVDNHVLVNVYGVGGVHGPLPSIAIGGYQTHVFHLGDALSADFASATVSGDHDGLVAMLEVVGPRGVSESPCTTQLGSDWYFADGSTQLDGEGAAQVENQTTLSLFNPSADVVSADVTAVALADPTEPTDPSAVLAEDQRDPKEWQNIQIPADTLVVLNVGDVVQRRIAMALQVHAEPGRIVVGRSIVRSGTSAAGVSITTGITPNATAYFAYGTTSSDVTERILSYVPAGSETNANVFMQPTYATSDTVTGIDAIERQIVPDQLDYFNVRADARVPINVDHAWRIESNYPMIVERSLSSVSQQGFAQDPGAATLARTWVVPVAGNAVLTSRLALASFVATDISVKFDLLQNGAVIQSAKAPPLVLKAGQQTVFDIGGALAPGPSAIVVHASKPIALEDLLIGSGIGYAITAGIPVG